MNFLQFYRVDSWVRNLGVSVISLMTLGIVPNNWTILIPILHIALIQMHSFSMNDYYDYKISREKNYISNLFKKNVSTRVIIFLSLLPLVFVLPTIKFSNYSFVFLFVYIISFYLYQSPIRLKNHYTSSIIINSICLGLIPYIYPYLYFQDHLSFQAIQFSIIFFFYMAFHEIIHQLAHRKKEKINSLPRIFGVKKTIIFGIGFLFIPLTTSLILLFTDIKSNLIFLTTVFFCVYRIYKMKTFDEKTDFQKIKSSWHKFYSVYEGVIYLLFLIFYNY
ncbi:MAG: UbiA prenyltransferase family protein [Candidatus Aenigmarchaeota archaeon]|nr:UbiA prenyltransferase family protein [Candidatus Aenigmarchaeota archaeon]